MDDYDVSLVGDEEDEATSGDAHKAISDEEEDMATDKNTDVDVDSPVSLAVTLNMVVKN